ncbi:MAG: universal stress protein [Pseudomonadota bacterium]
MRIIAAFDLHSYSERIVSDLADMAANTWADITILGVQPVDSGDSPDEYFAGTLRHYREEFIRHLSGNELPYGGITGYEEFVPIGQGRWEINNHGMQGEVRKKLLVRIRTGDPLKEILAESREQKSDLVMLGCTKGMDCQWQGEVDLPRKVAAKAACSVLVIKDMKRPDTIISFLDQEHVSQASLEMINQIVTLHQAELKIVGITQGERAGSEEGIKSRIAGILKYYSERRISAWIKLVWPEDLEQYVAESSREGMIALWMGKKSLLGKIFSRDLVGKLVSHSQSSVLILR